MIKFRKIHVLSPTTVGIVRDSIQIALSSEILPGRNSNLIVRSGKHSAFLENAVDSSNLEESPVIWLLESDNSSCFWILGGRFAYKLDKTLRSVEQLQVGREQDSFECLPSQVLDSGRYVAFIQDCGFTVFNEFLTVVVHKKKYPDEILVGEAESTYTFERQDNGKRWSIDVAGL